MSTVKRAPTEVLPLLEAGQHLDQPTFHERYEAMPPETRAELVGGVVYMASPVSVDHAEEDDNVGGWLFHYRLSTKGLGSGKNSTVILGEFGEVQPDGHLRIPEELGGQTRIERDYIVGAPELVVEIAQSSRDYDLNEKKVDYERAGVLEYLVVELDRQRIHWFIRRAKRFAALRPGPDGIYRSKVFPGLWLDPDALVTRDLDRLIRVLEQGLASPEHGKFVAKLAAAGRGRKPR